MKKRVSPLNHAVTGGKMWLLIFGGALCMFALAVCPARAEEPSDAPDPTGPTVFGQRGIFRAKTAETYPAGSLLLGASLEYFSASDFLVPGDESRRLAGRFTLALAPISGLEVAGGFSLSSSSNESFEPDCTQSIGDPYLGIRYGIRLTDSFRVGGGVQFVFPTGSSAMELSADGIGTRIVASLGFWPLPGAVIALNLGYHFDNSRFIYDYPINEAESFATGINPHDQLQINLGLAWRLGPVAPLIEYGTAIALGAGDLSLEDNPGWLTLGLRVWPLSNHPLHLLAALDIGLTGIHPPAGKGRIPPYNMILGVGYDFGRVPPPEPIVQIREVIRERRVEVPVEVKPDVPRRSAISGRVLDAQTGKPVGGVRVTVDGREGQVFVTDAQKGRFSTCPAGPGPHKLTLTREGYRVESQVVLATGKAETRMEVKLRPAKGETFGTLKVTVRRAGGGPLAATVSIPTRKIHARASRDKGAFDLKLRTGVVDLLISMPGYVTQRHKVEIEHGDVVILNVELFPKK